MSESVASSDTGLSHVQISFLKRRETKNAKCRARAAELKKLVAKIERKPKEEWTAHDEELLQEYNTKRERKNVRSRERALERKAEINRILAKPEQERTKVERAFLENALEARTRKNMSDRQRRELLKQLGIPEKVGLKRALAEKGKPVPAANKDLRKVIGNVNNNNNNNKAPMASPPAYPPPPYHHWPYPPPYPYPPMGAYPHGPPPPPHGMYYPPPPHHHHYHHVPPPHHMVPLVPLPGGDQHATTEQSFVVPPAEITEPAADASVVDQGTPDLASSSRGDDDATGTTTVVSV